MTGAKNTSSPEPEPEPEAKCFHTFGDEQSAALEQFNEALGAIATLSGYESTEGLDQSSEIVLTRRELAALFGMLRQAHYDIIGPDRVGSVWIDPRQVNRTTH